jgi:hypothetical protein
VNQVVLLVFNSVHVLVAVTGEDRKGKRKYLVRQVIAVGRGKTQWINKKMYVR